MTSDIKDLHLKVSKESYYKNVDSLTLVREYSVPSKLTSNENQNIDVDITVYYSIATILLLCFIFWGISSESREEPKDCESLNAQLDNVQRDIQKIVEFDIIHFPVYSIQHKPESITNADTILSDQYDDTLQKLQSYLNINTYHNIEYCQQDKNSLSSLLKHESRLIKYYKEYVEKLYTQLTSIQILQQCIQNQLKKSIGIDITSQNEMEVIMTLIRYEFYHSILPLFLLHYDTWNSSSLSNNQVSNLSVSQLHQEYNQICDKIREYYRLLDKQYEVSLYNRYCQSLNLEETHVNIIEMDPPPSLQIGTSYDDSSENIQVDATTCQSMVTNSNDLISVSTDEQNKQMVLSTNSSHVHHSEKSCSTQSLKLSRSKDSFIKYRNQIQRERHQDRIQQFQYLYSQSKREYYQKQQLNLQVYQMMQNTLQQFETKHYRHTVETKELLEKVTKHHDNYKQYQHASDRFLWISMSIVIIVVYNFTISDCHTKKDISNWLYSHTKSLCEIMQEQHPISQTTTTKVSQKYYFPYMSDTTYDRMVKSYQLSLYTHQSMKGMSSWILSGILTMSQYSVVSSWISTTSDISVCFIYMVLYLFIPILATRIIIWLGFPTIAYYIGFILFLWCAQDIFLHIIFKHLNLFIILFMHTVIYFLISTFSTSIAWLVPIPSPMTVYSILCNMIKGLFRNENNRMGDTKYYNINIRVILLYMLYPCILNVVCIYIACYDKITESRGINLSLKGDSWSICWKCVYKLITWNECT